MLAATRVYGQEASLAGMVTDESKAVLPGATVTASDLATGRQFAGVTDERGQYRLPGMTAGRYKVQAELQGFTTTVVPEIELLVGQNRTVPFELKIARLAESVTVFSEAPLVDTRSTQIAGNVDRRQMEDLPLSGRNWMELAMLVKGVTANDVGKGLPGATRDGDFELNLDGQQVTQHVSWTSIFSQPGLSREAIAEYQIVTNLFDVTQGRSAGMQVQAITRSGTNNLSGTMYGYFRNDALNAADFIAKQVLPYSNQQVGGSVGGPIVLNKLHYFTTYEYERQPNTIVIQPPGYSSSLLVSDKLTQKRFLARGDYQLSAKDQLSARFTSYYAEEPDGELTSGTSTNILSVFPTYASNDPRDTNSTAITWSRVLSNTMVQEVKFSFFHYHWNHTPAQGVPLTPLYSFPGLAVGARANYPEEFWQNQPDVRYDLTWHKKAHDLKIGAEYLRDHDTGWWLDYSRGVFVFSSLPADIAQRVPLNAWNDPSKWNLSGLDSIALRYTQAFAQYGGGQAGNCPDPTGCGNWSLDIPRPTYGIWFGDTWSASPRLTVNFGTRYDLDAGVLSPPLINPTSVPINNGYQTINIGYRNDLRDYTNVSPRAGVSYKVNQAGDLVIRGGSGLYSGLPMSELAFTAQLFNGQRVLFNTWNNDGKPGFVADPTRGVTSSQVLSGQVPLPAQSPYVISPDYRFPRLWQSVIGFQKQLNAITGVDADLIYYRGYHLANNYDPNVFYDPQTGFNLPPNKFGRPYPAFSTVTMFASDGKSEDLHLATALTRRFKDNFQLGVTYTLMFFRNDTSTSDSALYGQPNNNFCEACEFGRGADFQRHTLRMNGVYQLPHGFGLAGSYFFGSGNYFQITHPGNPYGDVGGSRIAADGSIIPRNTFGGSSLNKLDLRLTKRITLAGNARLEGIAEVFNVFN
ncbi:MAG TPA: TonB-dependent receptor, partial [Vicinamibacterales bacterium]|nr:TonB-dependent receptor [Vicinamibacterales bacterium]